MKNTFFFHFPCLDFSLQSIYTIYCLGTERNPQWAVNRNFIFSSQFFASKQQHLAHYIAASVYISNKLGYNLQKNSVNLANFIRPKEPLVNYRKINNQ